MIDILKADIYRLHHSKMIYTALAGAVVLAGLVVVPVGGGAMVGLMLQPYLTGSIPGVMTGAESLRYLLWGTSSFAYLVILIVLPVAAGLFSSGTIRNSLAAGIPRIKLYLSAWIISCGLSVAGYAAYLGSGVGLATLTHGPGDWAHELALLSPALIILAAVSALVTMVALTSIGVALAFVLRNATAGAVTFVVLVFLPVVLDAAAKVTNGYPDVTVAGIKTDISGLVSMPFYFFFPSGMMMSNQLHPAMNISAWAGQWSLVVGVVWISLATLAGMVAFRRREFR